jgi:hypothetical protein
MNDSLETAPGRKDPCWPSSIKHLSAGMIRQQGGANTGDRSLPDNAEIAAGHPQLMAHQSLIATVSSLQFLLSLRSDLVGR